MKEQWITIHEASKLVSKSNQTIKRLIDKSIKNQLPNQLRYQKKPANRGYSWKINKKDLLSHYGLIDQDNINNKSNDRLNNQSEIIKILKNELESKNRQISELHVLLKQAQDKVKNILPMPGKEKKSIFNKAREVIKIIRE
jgi:hypothetical protein